ncbi:hypothetical protein [Halobaculum gomorrense]|uniref:Phage integrase family protein n=1 Tax=Halobaculum gomorrense TaxID=43928 RepID=A0A1M5UQR4_9EURY|nr:hypothetical protein [Halobaculum gomorrense]SHH65321.1 hypothetical protein SAMN05443636_3093 [Halobaculum gomorrense]
MRTRWTNEYVTERFPDEVRALRREQGQPENLKPTHQWLVDNGFSGIQGYVDGEDYTVDDVLLDVCEFDPKPPKPLPGSHPETKRLIRAYLKMEAEDFNRLADSTIASLRSRFRRLIEISMQYLGTSNLLRPVRVSKAEGFHQIMDLYGGLDEELESEGSRINYALALVQLYNHLDDLGHADHNPAKKVLERKDWSYNRQGPEVVFSVDQICDCWIATDRKWSGDEAHTRRMIVLMFAGYGLRYSDVEKFDARNGVHLDRDDPVIEFEERKNGPGTVSALVGTDLLKYHIKKLKRDPDWNGKLFPNDEADSGSRSPGWFKKRIVELCEAADVTPPSGDSPVLGALLKSSSRLAIC